MKTVLQFLVVGLVIFTMSFSPALLSMTQAGGINFEGISSFKTEDTQSYEKQPSGLMLNFSFGAPKDYKKIEKLNGIPVSMLDESEDDGNYNLLVGTLIIGALVAAVVVIADDMPGATYMEFGSE
jgi:hypothetical protein